MPETLFGVSLSTYLVLQQGITDIATSILAVPVYIIHVFERPFCTDAHCSCQAHWWEVVTLFVKIIEGHVQIEQAAALLVENWKEHRA